MSIEEERDRRHGDGLACILLGGGGDEGDGFVVDGGEGAVEGGESGLVVLGEGDEVGGGDLTVADNAGGGDGVEGDVVREEGVAGVGGELGEDLFRAIPVWLGTEPKVMSDKSALGNGATGDLAAAIVDLGDRLGIVRGGLIRHRNEHVDIQQYQLVPAVACAHLVFLIHHGVHIFNCDRVC
jgi:hypothetical protein